jgi:hypothetical protein
MARSLAMATRGKLNPTTNEICYLAGIIDSDGCISISKMKPGKQRTINPRYVLTVNVVNTSEKLMNWLVEKFGGRYKVRRRVLETHKFTFDWWFNNGKALELLKTIEPYLIVKRERARLGIEFIENWVTLHGQGAVTPINEVERREEFYVAMKVLNRTGYTAATTKPPGSCSVQQDDAIVCPCGKPQEGNPKSFPRLVRGQ